MNVKLVLIAANFAFQFVLVTCSENNE